MKLKGEQLVIHDAATTDEVDSVLDAVRIVLDDDGLHSEMDSKSLKSHSKLHITPFN